MALSPKRSRSWPRLNGIDALRGLAILFVLMNHVNMQLIFAHVPYTRGLPKQLISSLAYGTYRQPQARRPWWSPSRRAHLSHQRA